MIPKNNVQNPLESIMTQRSEAEDRKHDGLAGKLAYFKSERIKKEAKFNTPFKLPTDKVQLGEF